MLKENFESNSENTKWSITYKLLWKNTVETAKIPRTIIYSTNVHEKLSQQAKQDKVEILVVEFPSNCKTKEELTKTLWLWTYTKKAREKMLIIESLRKKLIYMMKNSKYTDQNQ